MCDTIIAMPSVTADGAMLFGKNSDRQRNEAQIVEFYAAAAPAINTVRCTHISITQQSRTNAVLLCRPYWIWGAEMGANEHGVVIGNEGLEARSPSPQQPALTGMDLIRLALERTQSATEAVDLITGLLAQHGQGGDCGHRVPGFYNNSFIIADRDEAFLLETIDREWLLQRVHGSQAVSNCYTISRADRTSDGVDALLRANGWSPEIGVDICDIIQNPTIQHIGRSKDRQSRAAHLLMERRGSLTPRDMMTVLRDHGDPVANDVAWHPASAEVSGPCLHAKENLAAGQTTGSMVSQLHERHPVHWVTGTSAPCMSVFKPVFLDTPLPPHGASPTGSFDRSSLWWRHEGMHRAALRGDYASFIADIAGEREALELSMQSRIAEVACSGSREQRARLVSQCWQEAISLEDGWHDRLTAIVPADDSPYSTAWLEMNSVAGLAL